MSPGPSLRLVASVWATAALCLAVACGNKSPTGTAPGATDSAAFAASSEATADTATLAGLSGDYPAALKAAKAIAATGNEATKRAAGPLLVEKIKATGKPAHLDDLRTRVVEANKTAKISVTDEQLAWQAKDFQDEEMGELLKWGAKMGGPDIVAYCLELANDTTASMKRRHLALSTLDDMGPSLDAAASASAASASVSLSADTAKATPPKATVGLLEPVMSGGAVANAGATVAGMAAGFRRCYAKGLRDNPTMHGSMRIALTLGAVGDVLKATPTVADGDLSRYVVACVAARAEAAAFSAPVGGSATIDVPLVFKPE